MSLEQSEPKDVPDYTLRWVGTIVKGKNRHNHVIATQMTVFGEGSEIPIDQDEDEPRTSKN